MSIALTCAGIVAVVAGWIVTMIRFDAGLLTSAAWSVPCFALALVPMRTGLRAAWFNAGVVILVGGAFQPVLERTDAGPRCHEQVDGEAIWRTDPHVGYLPPRDASYRVTRICDDETIYRAQYTTDAAGNRLAGTNTGNVNAPCILVVGGSFAYGEGVDDEETLAHSLWSADRGRHEVRNLGVPGFGANHVLAAVEGGLVEAAAACDVRHVIYLAISDHIGRVSGSPAGSGDPDGPRYTLTDDGGVRRDGTLEQVEWSADSLLRAAARTGAGRRAYAKLGQGFTDEELELFARVVHAIDAGLTERYPEVELDVLWWDHGAAGATPLPDLGSIPVHRVTEILPPREDWDGEYELAGDGHPTALASRILADHIVATILDGPDR